MTDLERAKELLKDSTHTCVLCRGEETWTSDRTGIAPMLGFLEERIDLRGASAADRIVGKAAAMLFVLAGVTSLYAEVLSERALPVLEHRGIAVSWGTLTPAIINRRGDGPCPMEQAVESIDAPTEAFEAIRSAVARLKKQKEKES
ncbi:MAG: DUF1893 domain-containing protein [Clostridia bacterium]|nr:DUF1893 domain-containing protein [Clostridia bacterium]